MDHQVGAVAAVGGIVAVRKAGVDGEVIFRVGIEVRGRQVVETFRRLRSPSFTLGRVCRTRRKSGIRQSCRSGCRAWLPDFQRAFFLKMRIMIGEVRSMFFLSISARMDGEKRVINLVFNVGDVAFDVSSVSLQPLRMSAVQARSANCVKRMI